MAWLIQLSYLLPFILCNIVDFAFLGSIVWVLWTDGEEIILCLIIHSFVQMCQLVSRSSVLHVCSTLNIIRGFIDNKAVSCHDCPDIVFFFLTSNAENFVLNLDWAEIFWQDFWVVKFDGGGSLWVKLMDQKLIVIIIVIMQARFILLEDKVWFKWNNVMKETSELIQLWANLYLWSGVFLKVLFMLRDLLRECRSFCR